MKNIIESMEFTKKEFKEITEVIFATAKDQARPILQGVNFNNNDVVALDGYRLSLRKNVNVLEGSYTIHRDDMKIIIDTVKRFELSNNEKIIINFLENQTCELLINNVVIQRFNLMKGSYIKYKQLIPEFFDTEIEADTKQLKEAIKPLKKNTQVLINVNNNTLDVKDIISMVNKKDHTDRKIILGSTVNKAIETYKKGKDIEILFNHTYIKEAIKNYSNKEKLSIKFTGHLSPTVITDNKNKLDLILPVRKVWGGCEIEIAA